MNRYKLINAVNEYTEQNGISISKFMKLAGISRTSYYNYLSGQSEPSLRIALRICNILSKTVEEIFT